VTVDSIEEAGVPRAVSLEASLLFNQSGFLPPQSKTAYRVLWGKKDNNSNLLLGHPSERFVLTNTSNSVEVSETFQITFTSVPTTAEYFTFSSSVNDYFIWYQLSGTDEEPQTAETLGKTGIEINLSSPGQTNLTTASKTADAISNLFEFEVSISSNAVQVSVVEAENVDDVADYETSGGPATNFTTTVLEQGSVTEGTSANTTVNFSVPSGIDNTYFYQIYRTTSVTVPDGLTLDDIDPGDEMNLVFEGNPLDSNGDLLTEVTIEDITPEDFRASAAFLYTNPISGEGITQANSRPPVAKDIALFNGSTFFSNTKTTHKLTFNLVSVLSFTSGVSDFIIANDQVKRKYTAIGETQVQDIEVNSNTIGGKGWLIDSARNQRKYFVYFDEDGNDPLPTDSEFDNKIAVRVRYNSGDSTDDIAVKIATALATTGDFEISVLGSVMTITWSKNGIVTENARDSVSESTGFVFSAPSTEGDGEDTGLQEFLLSNQISVAASIDETARSIVKVINADSLSPVNAYYLSSANDVPGIILLEAKTLVDDTFYIATSDLNTQPSFDPSLNLEKTITSTTLGTATNIESVSHGYATGQTVFVENLASSPIIRGSFLITKINNNNFTIPFETTTDTLNEGEVFLGSNFSDNEEKPNRIYFSKSNRPEAVPIVNFIDIGPKDKPILRILPLRDNLFALKEDGIYIISGTSAPNFTVRLLDGSTELKAPDSAVVLNNVIYALTDEGVVRISDTGVQVISRPIENLIKNVVNSRFNFSTVAFGVSYSSDRSYLLWLPTNEEDTTATQCYRFNSFTRTWTRFIIDATCGMVTSRNDKLIIGAGDRNTLTQERKNNNRTDYSDRDFNLTLLPSGVSSNVLSVSTVSEVEKGDVVFQNQYVTLSVIRRLLQKLDIDNGVSSSNYEQTIQYAAGTRISNALGDINDKLITDGISVTPVVYSNDIETQKDQYNDLMQELNIVSSGTSFKDYSEVSLLVSYEVVVDSVTTQGNLLTGLFDTPFVEGSITIFKGIPVKVQYAPEHFGDPTLLKQIRQGTILFDQSAFYGGSIAYASDQSASFVSTNFSGLGIGEWGTPFWGTGTWGGLGNDVPFRTLIPLEKQRCRYLTVQINHLNAREIVRINGISLMVRQISNRAYK